MQNEDGGWPAFEKNTNSRLLSLLPIEGGNDMITDPSSADLTGRTLEFLGNYTNLTNNHMAIREGVKWLISSSRTGWFLVWSMGHLLYLWYMGCHHWFKSSWNFCIQSFNRKWSEMVTANTK